jgi:MFS family permease
MAASGLMIALASSFPVYMLGRALIGIVIGGFWSMSAATAIRLVPQRQVPAHWPSLTAVTRWPPSWQRRWAATWGHRRLARRLFMSRPAGDGSLHLAMR